VGSKIPGENERMLNLWKRKECGLKRIEKRKEYVRKRKKGLERLAGRISIQISP